MKKLLKFRFMEKKVLKFVMARRKSGVSSAKRANDVSGIYFFEASPLK
jgi:hypothetical protein